MRNEDIENIPLKLAEENLSKVEIIRLVKELEKPTFIENNYLESKIDELVYDIYDLTEYEKEIVREFYQIKVERAGAKRLVNPDDIKKYIAKFSEVFELMLETNSKLVATYKISANVGAVVCFTIIDKDIAQEPKEDNSLEVLNFVKKKQLQKADISKIINEDKVKLYDGNFFYLIKSNLFKDWTIRQSIKDAKEKIGLMLSHLPATHE